MTVTDSVSDRTFLMQYYCLEVQKAFLKVSVLLIGFQSYAEEKFPHNEHLPSGIFGVPSQALPFVLHLMSRQHLALYHFT